MNKCSLCENNFPVVNEFIVTNATRLAKEVPISSICDILAEIYDGFRKGSLTQGKKTPVLTSKQIEEHYRHHANNLLFTLLEQLEQVSDMIDSLKYLQPSASIVNTRIKLLNQKLKLVKELNGLPSSKNDELYIYKFS